MGLARGVDAIAEWEERPSRTPPAAAPAPSSSAAGRLSPSHAFPLHGSPQLLSSSVMTHPLPPRPRTSPTAAGSRPAFERPPTSPPASIDEPVRLRRPDELSPSPQRYHLNSIPLSPIDSVGPSPSHLEDPPHPPAYPTPLSLAHATLNDPNSPSSSSHPVTPLPKEQISPPASPLPLHSTADGHILLWSDHDGSGYGSSEAGDDLDGDAESFHSGDLVREQLVGRQGSDNGADESGGAGGLLGEGHHSDSDESDHGLIFDHEEDLDGLVLEEEGSEDADSDIDGAPIDFDVLEAMEEPERELERLGQSYDFSDSEPIRKRRRISPPSPFSPPPPPPHLANHSEPEEGEIPDQLGPRDDSSGTGLGDFSPVFSFLQQERSRQSPAATASRRHAPEPPSDAPRDAALGFATSTPTQRPSGVPGRLQSSPVKLSGSPARTRLPAAPIDVDSPGFFGERAPSSRHSPTRPEYIPLPSYERSDYDAASDPPPLSPVFGLPAVRAARRDAAALTSPAPVRPLSPIILSDSEEAGDATMDMDMSFDDLPCDLLGDPTRRAKGPISILQRPKPLEKASYQRRTTSTTQALDLHPATPKPGPALRQTKPSYIPSPILPRPPPASTNAQSHLRDELSKATYVRPPDGGKAVYERRGGIPSTTKTAKAPQPHPNKVPGVLPLSQEEKLAFLPAKLVAAFPELSLGEASSPRLYAPNSRSTPPVASKAGTQYPSEGSLFGFWPGPPSASAGKNVYPPPAVEAEPTADARRPRVDIFIDHSNVLYSFLNWARERPETKLVNYSAAQHAGKEAKIIQTVTIDGRKARIDYDVLFAILERGRKVGKRILVGSSPLWQSLEPAVEWSYEVSVLQRVPRPVAYTNANKRKLPPPAVPAPPVAPGTNPLFKGNKKKRNKEKWALAAAAEAQARAQMGTTTSAPPGADMQGEQLGTSASQSHPPNLGHPSLPQHPGMPMMHPPSHQHGTLANGTASQNQSRPAAIVQKKPPPAVKLQKAFKEQAVDELLHLKILESLLDYIPDPRGPRPILVLVTGDANSSEYNPTGFLGCARRALERGWDVEIIAFPVGTSTSWISEEARAAAEGATGGRGRLKVVDLAAFAEELLL